MAGQVVPFGRAPRKLKSEPRDPTMKGVTTVPRGQIETAEVAKEGFGPHASKCGFEG